MHTHKQQHHVLSPYTIIVQRTTQRVLLASEEACQLLGYTSPHQLLGLPTKELQHHDVLFRVHYDVGEPYDYWCLELRRHRKRQKQQQQEIEGTHIVRLSPYGIIQHAYSCSSSSFEKHQYNGEPIMRRVHPDDVQALCRCLNEAYQNRYSQHTISLRWRYQHEYRPSLFTVALARAYDDNNKKTHFNDDSGNSSDRSIGIIRPHDFCCYYYGRTIFRYVMAYMIHLLLYTLFFFMKPSSTTTSTNTSSSSSLSLLSKNKRNHQQEHHRRTIKVNNQVVVHVKHQMEDQLRARCLTAVADLRSFTDSNTVVQKVLEWLEGTGVVKNKHGLVDSVQVTMENALDRVLT
ncbi:hypothetical protein BDB00DRAFT_930427 [Zychaea mexicana]|uniref:uncharacterized protein n=1 Tax=Zychaea mexicana TaxID=64656 RepID=UPI0022FE1F95|nr:uncharacterized protein BDB00DRAFT_930427 [Zychaea mexicana]KAI9491527.1 hypothetical protein BDB00DRAFT_930427 [Zychaea mexicana]